MKLAIWQQFSSNHSGSFSIVGKFENPQAAEAAAVKLREIVDRAGARYEDSSDEHAWWRAPSEVEYDILDELGLHWDMTFGFTSDATDTLRIAAFQEFLLLRIGETWNCHEHRVLRPVLEKLGASQIGIESEIDGRYLESYRMKVLCKAPDTSTADEIYTDTLEAINAIQTNTPLDKNIAWFDLRNLWENDNVEIDKDGLNLYFTLHFTNPFSNLPTLITGLREKGCTDFAYDFYKIEGED